MKILTHEQKALIEKEAEECAYGDLFDYIEDDWSPACIEEGIKFGMTEVLTNPEKYGLTSIENLESYKHQRDFYRNKIRESKGGKSVIDGLEGELDNDSKISQS